MRLFFAVFITMLFWLLNLSAQQPVFIQNDFKKKEFGFGEITYIAAGDSVQNLLQAQDYSNRHFFLSSNCAGINLGIAKDNYWVRLQLINISSSEHTLFLNLENPRLNEVDVFFIQQQKVTTFKLGDNFPFNNRLVFNNLFTLPVLLAKGDSLEIFLFMKHRGNTLQVPINLYSKNEFLKTTEDNYLFFGFTTGVLIIILVFSIFFLFNYFSALFLFYALYIFSLLGWLWSTEGYGFQYFWSEHPDWATKFGPGFSVLNLFTFTLVLLAFSKPYDAVSKGRKLVTLTLLLTGIWAVIPFLPIESILDPHLMAIFLKINFTQYIIILFIIMAYLFWLSVKKNRIVLYYFFAVIISIISTLMVIAKHTGWIQFSMSSGQFMSTGIILEVVLMTAGITRQLYSYKKEKEAALMANIEQQKSITTRILQMQEAERMRISKEMHDDLGSGLTQITLMSELARMHEAQGAKTNVELSDISQTSRRLVESVSEIIWAMNSQNNSLDNLLIYLREQLGKFLDYSGKKYSIDFAEVHQDIVITNEQRRNISMLLKEMVNNVVKHSDAKEINITATLIKQQLKFQVRDNGKGFDINRNFSGNGLKNYKQRVAYLHGILEIESKIDKGTTVQFSISLS